MNIEKFEDIIFGKRKIIIGIFLAVSLLMLWAASGLRPDASLEKMVPLKHPYIQNLFKHKDELSLGNDIKIAVAVKKGDIFDPAYLETVKLLTDDVFYLSDMPTPEEAEQHQIVDRSKLKSLWTPNVRWSEVTKEGFQGGEVTQGYEGNIETLDALRSNILRSGQVGRLVADDFQSTIVQIPLIDGEKIDYRQLSANLETLRQKYEQQNPNVEIHIVGFAKKVGDLIEGASKIVFFFLIAALITLVLLVWDFRDVRASLLILGCSLAAVVWQLGLARILGFGIDPYSMLVPFVVFAIAISHSVQIVNAIFGEVAKGAAPEAAARQALSSLFKPGVLALTTDIIGFLTLLIIEIDVIRALAISASIGTFMIAFTNFLMLPLLLANFRVSPAAMRKLERRSGEKSAIWRLLSKKTERGPATVVVALGAILLVGGFVISQGVKIGDLDRGAPELRPDSRYNMDDLFITSNYSISADVLVVMVETSPQMCSSYSTLESVDRLQWTLENVPGVQSAQSLVTAVKRIQSGFNEGNLKWSTLVNDDAVLNESSKNVPELFNSECSLVPVFVFLDDHKAETLQRVTGAVEEFAKANNTADMKFQLASGNAGIEAATNEVIAGEKTPMMLLVYGVVIALCFWAFRSWRPVVCVILPLVVTSVLCEALMAKLGIGIKVATMPVIALGVGIGVDYGLYIFAKLEEYLRAGKSLTEAYLETLASTGKAVLFTGLALAIGVFTWVFSPIKFQADMGLLLTVMFLWNMLGALIMIPALAYFVVKPEQYRA
ncbi:MAG: transport protein [Moraxellaceae bacterium]|jgi:predicted RND superfamily exporter protein|nr:transport protein [Moraxellaceae bacterium]